VIQGNYLVGGGGGYDILKVSSLRLTRYRSIAIQILFWGAAFAPHEIQKGKGQYNESPNLLWRVREIL
jgi:hypothetical protein